MYFHDSEKEGSLNTYIHTYAHVHFFAAGRLQVCREYYTLIKEKIASYCVTALHEIRYILYKL